MIISVDTSTDSASELRAAAKLILSLADERAQGATQPAPVFPPHHADHEHEVRADLRDEAPVRQGAESRAQNAGASPQVTPRSALRTPSIDIVDLVESDEDESASVLLEQAAPSRQQPPAPPKKDAQKSQEPLVPRLPPGVHVY